MRTTMKPISAFETLYPKRDLTNLFRIKLKRHCRLRIQEEEVNHHFRESMETKVITNLRKAFRKKNVTGEGKRLPQQLAELVVGKPVSGDKFRQVLLKDDSNKQLREWTNKKGQKKMRVTNVENYRGHGFKKRDYEKIDYLLSLSTEHIPGERSERQVEESKLGTEKLQRLYGKTHLQKNKEDNPTAQISRHDENEMHRETVTKAIQTDRVKRARCRKPKTKHGSYQLPDIIGTKKLQSPREQLRAAKRKGKKALRALKSKFVRTPATKRQGSTYHRDGHILEITFE